MLQRGPHCGSSVVLAHASRTAAPSRRKVIRSPLTHRQDYLFSSIPRASPTPGVPQHPRRESLRKRHQLIPGIPGFPATPLRRTVLAGITGRQLLRGPQGEADAPRALSPCSRPSAWPPSRLMFQVPTYTLSWQCHIMHCPLCWFALSYTPTAFTDQCPLQVCRHLQSRCLRPQP